MKKLLIVMVGLVFAFSSNIIPTQAISIDNHLEPETDITEIIYNENILLDASTLIPDENLLSQPREIELPTARAEWNMVKKNLNTGTLNFFYFDETSTSSNTRTTSSNSYVKTYADSFGNVSLYTDPYIPSSVQNNPTTRTIIGTDERTKVENPSQWPYSATGYILTTFNNVLNASTGNYVTLNYIGSAFLEGPNLMVTAGHCLFGDVTNDGDFQDNLFNPRFPDRIRFYPAKNGSSTPFGYVEVTEIHLEKSYYTNSENDWGCCLLASNIGNSTGWYGKISNYYVYGKQVSTWGYPGDKNGEMWKATGTLIGYESNTNNYRYNMDTVSGQSGSPVYVSLDTGDYVCGIHTYSNTSYNGGARIDSFMFAYLNYLYFSTSS